MIIACSFDAERFRPLHAVVLGDDNKIKQYSLYAKGSGRTFYDVQQDIAIIKQQIEDAREVVCNDWYHILRAFNIEVIPVVYDVTSAPLVRDHKEAKTTALEIFKQVHKSGKPDYALWRALAAQPYSYLTSRGCILDGVRQYPMWFMDTFSGRSRNEGISLQGLSENADITIEPIYDVFINFDWVAADIRTAGYLSNDQDLLGAYKNGGDPYSYVERLFNQDNTTDKITRDEVKTALISSIYKMDVSSPVLEAYPTLRSHIESQHDKVRVERSLLGYFGRRYHVDEERSTLSVFNATIQGSVASMMNVVLYRVWEQLSAYLLLENHDSLVMMCRKSDITTLKMIIDLVSSIMRHPLETVGRPDIEMPVVVSVGNRYKHWSKLKRVG